MDTQEIINSIKAWNPFVEHITLSTIFAKMRMNRGSTNVINFGSCGTGKSRSSLELIKALDLGTDIVLDNSTTDRGLFETFLNYPEQDIILDECSTLLKDLGTQDMIKIVMEGKSLVWTKNGSVETTDPYRGNIIINTNVQISNPVIDRCLTNKAIMNKEMSLAFNKQFVSEYINPPDFKPFINYIRKIILNKSNPDLTNEEINMVLEFVQNNIDAMEEEEDYSRRIIIRELNYFRHVKKLFGCLSPEVIEYITPFAKTYIVNAQTPGLMESILGNGPMEKAQLVIKLSHDGGYTERHARRVINEELESGKFKLTGKIISLANRKV